MADQAIFEDINEAKANLDGIYEQSDPRAYFRELKRLDYAIPGAAKPIFRHLIDRLRGRRGDPLRLLDLGCSYGVNAALLKYDLSMAELYDHWGQEQLADMPSDEVVAHDCRYFANLRQSAGIEVIGLDQSAPAVAYGEATGLLDEGFAVDLENEVLPAAANAALRPATLVISTGCVGYVTERTFERLLSAFRPGRLPWMANFVLRMFPFEPIARALEAQGYVTEKLADRAFVQRRFATERERAQVLHQLAEQNVDTKGMEDRGELLAEFYLSRPKQDAAELPLERLLAA